MFAQRDRMGVRSYGGYQRVFGRMFCGESQNRLEFCVERKVLGVFQGERAAVFVQLVGTLLSVDKLFTGAKGILQKEVCGVDQDRAVFFRFDLEAGENGLGKRLIDGQFLHGIGRGRTVLQIRCDQKNAGADAGEVYDPLLAQPAAVQSNVIRSQPVRQGNYQQEILVKVANLQKKLSRLCVPCGWEQAVRRLHASDAIVDGRSGFWSRGGGWIRRGGKNEREQYADHHEERGAGDWHGHLQARPEYDTNIFFEGAATRFPLPWNAPARNKP